MGYLYLIRHAQSEANSQRIMASRLPFGLTESGKTDADLIAAQLSEKVSIQRIISSPLIRARETAESFSRVFAVLCEEDDRISEQDLGIYSGMTYDQVKKEPQYEMNTEKRWNWVPAGGGESYEMIAKRVQSFFASLNTESRENILIVTHAVTFRLIRAVLENTLPLYPSSFPNNGEIWKIDYKGLGQVHPIESLLLGNSRDFVHNP
ncbi:histidine phosphatase family protein [Oceanispirochaeta sp.]|jgi:broad specificity phosphatase PhoE|uniref:histidine phosphatase family protein n=1 Tax=Oceanispirochaeta sp. TaxID=2035350 RepID=UPI0026390EE1|nr:histidine phosphatase family protein [Oceanispirochaeta sp.]MDA3956804.1 histidine phosphatase family protein [Oceanispirochaeta sp.]